MNKRTRPANVLLDLLRSSAGQELPVQALIRYGAVFGFSANKVRVTLSRLAGRGLVSSPSRGRYRLGQRSDPVHAFVERWRLGEARVRPWSGQWLLAVVSALDDRSRWSLHTLGFRALCADNLWCRPDNLALSRDQLRDQAMALGLDQTICWWQGVPQAGARQPHQLWDARALEQAYGRGTAALETSLTRLSRLPLDEALRESFTLGGEVIHRLAKDPLLPEEMVDVTGRQRLWERMQEYDQAGREIWSRLGAAVPQYTPRPQLLPVA